MPKPIRIPILEPGNCLQRHGGERTAPLPLSAATVAPRRRAHVAEFAELPAIGSAGPAGAGLVGGTGTAVGAGGGTGPAGAGGTEPV